MASPCAYDRGVSSKSENPEEKILEYVREGHEAYKRRVAQIEAGVAEPWVYEALEVAYATPGVDADEELKKHAISLMAESEETDAETLGQSVGRKLQRAQEFRRGGGLRSLFPAVSNLLGSDDLFKGVKDSIALASQIKLGPVEVEPLGETPLASWRRASEERADRQLDALEGMLGILRRQHTVGKLALIAGTVAAVAAVVAAVAAIIGLF
jgi:hypothetical protein